MPALYTWTFGSDQHGYTSNFEAVCDEIVSSGGEGDFHVTVGDHDMTGVDPYESSEVNRAVIDDKFGSDTIWYPIMSNHVAETPADMTWMRDEYSTGQSGTRTALKYFTNQDGPAGSKETQYTFDWGPVRFVALNLYASSDFSSDSTTNAGRITTGQLYWCGKTFKKAVKDGMQIIVLGHEPGFNNVNKQGACLDRDKTTRDLFFELMEQYGVLAYICGHSHFYSSYIPNSEVLADDESWDHEPIRPPDFGDNLTIQITDGHYGNTYANADFTYGRGEIWSDKVVINMYRNASGDLVTWAASDDSPITLNFREVSLPAVTFVPKISVVMT